MVAVGGVVSLRVTVTVSVAVLPAASRAVTVSTFAPSCRPIPLTVQLVVPVAVPLPPRLFVHVTDRKSTRLNSSHQIISYAVFCLKKKKKKNNYTNTPTVYT